jgi:hypothetical protein
MRSEPLRLAGPTGRAVTVSTPNGLAVLPVDDARQGVALVLAIAWHWPTLPTPVLVRFSAIRERRESDREPSESTETTSESAGTTGRDNEVSALGAALAHRLPTPIPAA